MYQAALALIILILLFYVSGYIGSSGSKLMLKWICGICVFESRCEKDKYILNYLVDYFEHFFQP
jgi:hypothetical protein